MNKNQAENGPFKKINLTITKPKRSFITNRTGEKAKNFNVKRLLKRMQKSSCTLCLCLHGSVLESNTYPPVWRRMHAH